MSEHKVVAIICLLVALSTGCALILRIFSEKRKMKNGICLRLYIFSKLLAAMLIHLDMNLGAKIHSLVVFVTFFPQTGHFKNFTSYVSNQITVSL